MTQFTEFGRDVKKALIDAGETQDWLKPYAVGYVTNAIDSGHKQGKGRFVPGLKPQSWHSEKQPYGARLKADRVAGKGVYAGARQRAERIAYQAAERFVKKIQQKLKEG